MMVPRASYFPLHADDAFFKTRFQEFAVKLGENDEVWLEADGRPLKWCVVPQTATVTAWDAR